jgi:hypothetical protein
MINKIDNSSPEEFSEMFFASVDEFYLEYREQSGSRQPDWEHAVERAKREGVVPLREP